MKIVVLDGFGVNPGDLCWDFFGKYGELKVYDKTAPGEVVEKCRGAGIIYTNRVVLNSENLGQLQDVRMIGALGTGYDMIDINYCRERGIAVCNVPGYSSDSVAQLAFTLLINLACDINGLAQIVKDGMWTGIPGFHYEKVRFWELAGKTVGLIGFGGIGRRMGEMCSAFKMRVVASTKSRSHDREGNVEFLPLDELLSQSDFVSLHCPLNDETRGMVNTAFINKMKHGAVLINTARGAVLNEHDVADALNCGKLGGAGLDVLATEPPDGKNPLLGARNCIITPHCAWTPIEARGRLMHMLEENIKSFVESGRGIYRIV